MKKLRKSSNSRKPVVIFIYGPQAVGKFTVAKILSKKTGYKLTHNHALNNLIDELFNRGTYENGTMKDRLRYDLLQNAVRAGINFVTTHCYAHDYVSPAGLTDPKYVEDLEKKLTRLGAVFYPIQLKASPKELLRRVGMKSRKEFKKLTDRKIMRALILKHNWRSSPKLKNNFIIENTYISPQKVASMIIKHFKLKV
ncbi:hypothetical protein A3D42_03300 [Candidatus Nomurabacteria bacterium RIFCSPHIGHO2_02_FULL_41_18]|uniref:Shikimate kinase n=1 Tax=Candidatus Nomurabacteria bacterium RIFCSPHIGHO2_02_FULL_41_18 TaxID=1801754 RepID=A0A1F6W858_9BACT|nr:MAG: hypothetical protein A2737_01390 [Candidatus Nomurabacteria bacterium RIFCSPHIGHO2_01_FULL_41_71]OGI78059.1 MAG: hypothetical protein A3D42_03300 [Candidatus Nomurabacteria bacterium RIFCSPHIGHO2_02_FULL_41_18]OGI90114.1 MAG: hypothetical protein A3B01_03340 [Candidatus Nomurabacteria bacterium RIFCSPLOWO2_01_FULL_41_52b]OGJ00208.1 MAG: hypothetical protein A3I90_01950 [Candidatus Nomurabacteria bacterium RIFCSPLOWO2_02_FULL_41_9]